MRVDGGRPQPCGWLASYIGSALTTDVDLLFRNLDGTGTFYEEIFPTSGTLRTRVKVTDVSRSAGMIIESFEVECFIGQTLVYKMNTVFGFFPAEAFVNQVDCPSPRRTAPASSFPRRCSSTFAPALRKIFPRDLPASPLRCSACSTA